MCVRMYAALAALLVWGHGPLLAKEVPSIGAGDTVFIQMTGDLAAEYARRVGALNQNRVLSGLECSTSARVAQTLPDGRIRVEYTSHVIRDAQPARLLTLSATVDPAAIEEDVTPKGTQVYASPGAHDAGEAPALTTKETRTLRLRLADLKGVKLRVWTLSEELGD